MTRRARGLRGALALAWSLTATLALAWGGSGGSGGGTAPSDPAPGDAKPTASQYQVGLENGSYADAYYEVYRCSQPSPAVYTTLRAMASTSSGSYKSSYLAHNVRLYANGRLLARSPDVARSVSAASETNYITSLNPVSVSHGMSCPEAFVATVQARGWHKGISIHGYSHTLYTYDDFYG